MNKINTIIILFGTLLIFNSCVSNELAFPIEPKINFVSISPAVIREGEPFEISISYQDGDGDLGYESNQKPDSTYDFVVIDPRSPLPNGIQPDYNSGVLPYLTPKTKNPSIQGEIKYRLEGVGIVNQLLDEEKVKFSIYIRDRQNHRSNIIETTELTIQK